MYRQKQDNLANPTAVEGALGTKRGLIEKKIREPTYSQKQTKTAFWHFQVGIFEEPDVIGQFCGWIGSHRTKNLRKK